MSLRCVACCSTAVRFTVPFHHDLDTRRREWLHSTLPRHCASISAGNRAAGVDAVGGQGSLLRTVRASSGGGPRKHALLVQRSVIVVILF